MLLKQGQRGRSYQLSLITLIAIVFAIFYLRRSDGITMQTKSLQETPIKRKIFIDKEGNEIPVFDENTLYPRPDEGFCTMTNITDKEQYFQVVENPRDICKNLKEVALYVICMDNFKKQNNCVVISFGISFDFEYEDWLVNNLGCQAHSFDPTMDKPNHLRLNGKDNFYNLGVSSFKGFKTITYHDRKNRIAQVDRYVNIVNMIGLAEHEIDFFKMDIEGSELDFFLDTASTHPELLKNINQIQLEFHHMESIADHSGNRKDTSQFDLMKIIDILHCHGFGLAHSYYKKQGRQTYMYNGRRRSMLYITTWIRI